MKSWRAEVGQSALGRMASSAESKAAEGQLGKGLKIQQPTGSEDPPWARNVPDSANEMGSKAIHGSCSHEARWDDETKQVVSLAKYKS